MGAPSAPDDTAYDGSINTEPEPSVSFETAPSTAVEHHHTNPTPNSEYDSELSDAGDETETELDDAFDDANYSDESIPTFSSSKMIAECDDVVRVAAFPTPPVVEKEDATEVDWAAATPPPHLWPKDKEDLFANNPGGARTWDEVEAAMHRLVLYHAVRDTERSNSLSWRAARDAPRTRARAHASRCSTGAAAASALLRITCTGREWCPHKGPNNRLASADRGLAVGGSPLTAPAWSGCYASPDLITAWSAPTVDRRLIREWRPHST